MGTSAYVLVLAGDPPGRVHSPDCAWVRSSVNGMPSGERKCRDYEQRPSSEVRGVSCLICGGAPGAPSPDYRVAARP